jgi:hypothetical protein
MRAQLDRPAAGATRRRPRRARAAAAPWALELQSSAGNAAVAGLLQRQAVDLPPRRPKIKPNVVFMMGEQVEVANKEEQHEAERILGDIKRTYGIRLSSPMAMAGLWKMQKEFAGDTKGLTQVGYSTWNMTEIRALAEGLKRFAPILGKQRQSSSRKGKWQEVTSLGKLTSSVAGAKLATDIEGEAFGETKSLALYDEDMQTKSLGDFKTKEEELVATIIHELTHNLMEYARDDWEASLPWWSDGSQGEAPINSYANSNANEDLSESVAYYFLEPDTLRNGVGKKKPGEIGNACPRRFALVDKYVKGWKPKG